MQILTARKKAGFRLILIAAAFLAPSGRLRSDIVGTPLSGKIGGKNWLVNDIGKKGSPKPVRRILNFYEQKPDGRHIESIFMSKRLVAPLAMQGDWLLLEELDDKVLYRLVILNHAKSRSDLMRLMAVENCKDFNCYKKHGIAFPIEAPALLKAAGEKSPLNLPWLLRHKSLDSQGRVKLQLDFPVEFKVPPETKAALTRLKSLLFTVDHQGRFLSKEPSR